MKRGWFRKGGLVHLTKDEMCDALEDHDEPELVVPLSWFDGCETPEDVAEVFEMAREYVDGKGEAVS